jgi:hypothetical protein
MEDLPQLQAEQCRGSEGGDGADSGATQTDRATRMIDRSLQPKVGPDCSKKLKDIGVFVIVVSVFITLSICISVPNLGTVGEIGRFAHDISPLVLCMGVWGLATGIGLLRAWRWARISMLVFSSLLAVSGALGVVGFLFMPNGNMSGWSLFLLKVGTVLFTLIPVAIGVRWFIYFTRNNVRAHFQNPLKTQ